MTTEAAERLPASIAPAVSLPFVLASVALAAAYGATFLLADAFAARGLPVSVAGSVISVGTVTTIVAALLAGRLAERIGLIEAILAAAVAMGLAMACFAAAGWGTGAAHAGGLFLGIGWSVFYILAPIQVIACVRAEARLKYLTLLSGSQMLGIGLAAPAGRWLAGGLGSFPAAFAAFAAGCAGAVALLAVARRLLRDVPQMAQPSYRLTAAGIAGVMRGRTAFPVIMIGLGACVFAGLSTFQSVYAEARGLTPDIFFVTFTVTVVVLRFAVSGVIGRVPVGRLTAGLYACVLVGLGLLLVNEGSAVVYCAATVAFATGYGLAYSTLNGFVVHLAGATGRPVAVASQVFTLSYFLGLFGFPYLAGAILAGAAFDTLLVAMAGLVAVNLLLLAGAFMRPAAAADGSR
ncbi:MAG: MFS transporter [Azospirillaceae bacterium]